MDTFISTDDARERILSAISALPPVRSILTDSIGLVLAEEIVAPSDVPAFDNSAMDGFAFRWQDVSKALELIGESAAGIPFDGIVGPGQAVRIMTGAAVPEGADTVAMREVCSVDGDAIRIDASAARGAGSHIRHRGTYMAQGAPVLEPGDVLHAGELGVIASFGRTVLRAHPAPRVAIVTTGTELVEPDQRPGPGQIVNSNAYMLEGLFRAAGAEPVVFPIVADDRDATKAALHAASGSCDLVVTVGGVSVGDYDFVREVLDELTGGMEFWKVRMKPGKPLAFGTVRTDSTPIIGLPGNPVSSFVGFHQFVRPALRILAGHSNDSGSFFRSISVPLAADITSTPRRRQYVLGRLTQSDRETAFLPFPNQSSGNVTITCRCTAMGLIEEGVSNLAAGDLIEVDILTPHL